MLRGDRRPEAVGSEARAKQATETAPYVFGIACLGDLLLEGEALQMVAAAVRFRTRTGPSCRVAEGV